MSYTPLDAWAAIDARIGEHLTDDPTEGGLHRVLEELRLDPEQLTIATQSKISDLITLLATAGLPGVLAVTFAAGALWKERELEGYGASEATEPESIVCPVCGQKARERVRMGNPPFEDVIYLKCAEGHRWDQETGMVVG
jgi:hypothetical protein